MLIVAKAEDEKSRTASDISASEDRVLLINTMKEREVDLYRTIENLKEEVTRATKAAQNAQNQLVDLKSGFGLCKPIRHMLIM